MTNSVLLKALSPGWSRPLTVLLTVSLRRPNRSRSVASLLVSGLLRLTYIKRLGPVVYVVFLLRATPATPPLVSQIVVVIISFTAPAYPPLVNGSGR